MDLVLLLLGPSPDVQDLPPTTRKARVAKVVYRSNRVLVAILAISVRATSMAALVDWDTKVPVATRTILDSTVDLVVDTDRTAAVVGVQTISSIRDALYNPSY